MYISGAPIELTGPGMVISLKALASRGLDKYHVFSGSRFGKVISLIAIVSALYNTAEGFRRRGNLSLGKQVV